MVSSDINESRAVEMEENCVSLALVRSSDRVGMSIYDSVSYVTRASDKDDDK